MGFDIFPKGITNTIAVDIVFFADATGSALAPSAFNLEMDMIKLPAILTRRSAFRAGVGLAGKSPWPSEITVAWKSPILKR